MQVTMSRFVGLSLRWGFIFIALSPIAQALFRDQERNTAKSVKENTRHLRHGTTSSAKVTDGRYPLWTYWDDSAPPDFVKLCLETLRRHSTDQWELHVITNASVQQYVSLEDLPPAFYKLRPSFKADAVRLAVLRRQGGAWIDATAVAVKDLAAWINPEFSDGKKFVGFYIDHFTNPHGLPLVASWAMAVRGPEEPLLVAWHKAYLRLWRTRVDEDGITDDPFFQGTNLCCVNPLMRDYLNIELVLLALVQKDVSLREELMDHSTLWKAEDGAYSVQANMGLPWMTQNHCAPVRDSLSSFPPALQSVLQTTPLLKFRHEDRKWLVSMPTSVLLRNPDSLIGSLLTTPGANNTASVPEETDDIC